MAVSCVVTTQDWGNEVYSVQLHWERIPGSLCMVSPGLHPIGIFPLLIDLCIFLLEEIIAIHTLSMRVLLANP